MLSVSTLVAAPPLKTVLAPDGSESAPGIAFANDPSTGLYLTNGVLCITVHGNTVARFDQNGNTALSGATIGPNAAYSLAAGSGCVADSFGAISLGQNNYVGGIVGYAIGSNNRIETGTTGSGALGVDHYVAGSYSLSAGDGNSIFKSAQGAFASGTSHVVGEDNFTDNGSYTLTSGIANNTTGHANASFGLFLSNTSDYSVLAGNGPLLRSPLTLSASAKIAVGANTTTPTATLP